MSAADRRAAILDAAMEAFATRGYHGTSLDDVAAAAGVSKALIYEHFSSKQNLHDTLISVQAGDLFGRLAAAADPRWPLSSGCGAGSTSSWASSRSVARRGARCFATPPTRISARSSSASRPRRPRRSST
ncbi:MAG: helix-turn-helix domain-containing protein [Solirubrobacterales bacterium]